MPVIKIFCAQAPLPTSSRTLGVALRDLCMSALGARPDAIQIALIAGTSMLEGQPLLVEVHYRDRPDRRGSVLTDFLAELDRAVQTAFGQAPRIRSYSIDPATLGAVR